MGEKLKGKWAVYAGLEKIGRISTIDEDGMPHTTPVFYAMIILKCQAWRRWCRFNPMVSNHRFSAYTATSAMC